MSGKRFWIFSFSLLLVLAGLWALFFRKVPIIGDPAEWSPRLLEDQRDAEAKLALLLPLAASLVDEDRFDLPLAESWMGHPQSWLHSFEPLASEASDFLLKDVERPASATVPGDGDGWLRLHRLLVLDGIRLLKLVDLAGLDRLRAARRLTKYLLALNRLEMVEISVAMAGEWSLAMVLLLPRDSAQAVAGMPSLTSDHWTNAVRDALAVDLSDRYRRILANHELDDVLPDSGWWGRITFDLGRWLQLERGQHQAFIAWLDQPLRSVLAAQPPRQAWWHSLDHAGSRQLARQSWHRQAPRLKQLHVLLTKHRLMDDIHRLRTHLISQRQIWQSEHLEIALAVLSLKSPVDGELYRVGKSGCLDGGISEQDDLLREVQSLLPLCPPSKGIATTAAIPSSQLD